MEKKPVSECSDAGCGCHEVNRKMERKPVFCAHQDIRSSYEIPATFTCGLCRRTWKDDEDQPVAIIGYVEAGEDGGRGK